jgi:hypothetical protein
MMLKFVASEVDGFGQKRKQSPRACDQCRKKKKRCNHLADSRPAQLPASHINVPKAPSRSNHPTLSGSDACDNPSPRQHPSHVGDFSGEARVDMGIESPTNCPVIDQQNLNAQQASAAASNAARPGASSATENVHSRFIGDLNPEGIFLAATSPEATRRPSQNDSIGIWLAEKLTEKASQLGPSASPEPARSSILAGSGSLVQKVLLSILEADCLSPLQSSPGRGPLCAFYFEKVHPIFPVINEARFRRLSSSDPARILLEQGMCLVASMNSPMQQHLRFSEAEPLLSHSEFGKRLCAAMRTSIELGLVNDKIAIIQALALISFFIDGADGREISSMACGRAVQYVHSLGLHVQGRDRNQDDDDAITLLCCIWALDRLNAAFHGIPVLMHERDIGRDLKACFDNQAPCFRLFLRVVMLLDTVIGMYRPTCVPKESEGEEEFWPFEELVMSCGALQVPTTTLGESAPFSRQCFAVIIVCRCYSSAPPYQETRGTDNTLLATIEILYHAVAILSCRSKSDKSPVRPSKSYSRQSFSADQITKMIGHDFHDQLILLPFVPYAASLSLSLAYREMRHSKLAMYRARARAQLQKNCQVLEELGKIFWSASIMADMGKSTLKELDRVHSAVTDSQRRKSHVRHDAETSGATTTNGLKPSSALTGPGMYYRLPSYCC